jgi:hypothetical protein
MENTKKYSLQVSIIPSNSNYQDYFDTLEECESAIFRFKEIVATFNDKQSEISIMICNIETQIYSEEPEEPEEP